MNPNQSNRRTRRHVTDTETPRPRSTRKRVQSAIAKRPLVFGALLIAVGGALASTVHWQQRSINQNIAQTQQSDEMIENLEYQTILPESKTIGQLGGWRRISPQGKTPVYAYGDKLEGVAISISQQPLPDTFIGKSEQQVTELAKAYSATTELNADGTKVYLGTSSKGPQSVIFTKNNLLVMIKSEQKLPNETWTEYISQLK